MTSTDKELARVRRIRRGCAWGHGRAPQSDCVTCGHMVAAFWALFDPAIQSPMKWDDTAGKFVYKK